MSFSDLFYLAKCPLDTYPYIYDWLCSILVYRIIICHHFPLVWRTCFQFSSVAQLCPTLYPWTAAHQASLSITNSQSLLKLISIKLVIPANHLILCCPLLLWPSIFPNIRVFSSELVLHIRWPNYWSFSISPSNEYSGLISFTIDGIELLAVQGTLKSLLQCCNSKASVLCHSAFFMVQLFTSIYDYWKNYSFG